HQLPFADLLNGWKVESNQPYTINGVHQNAYGDALIAQRLWAELFGTPYPLPENAASRQQFDALQAAVVDLQWHHHQDYRMVNGWYVYGSRSKANDQNTFAAEYAKIRKMCADRDEVVWAIAQGKEPPVPDDAN